MHFSGHGIAGPGEQTLFLATRETRLDNFAWTAEQMGTWLGEAEATTDGPPVLFMLDVCGAGRAVMQQVVDRIRAADRRAWVIAACASDEKTYAARFTSATGIVMERLSQGRLDISPTVQHVPVETLAREIDRELARSAAAEVLAAQSVLRTAHTEARVPVPPFLLNPSYRASAGGQFLQSVEMGLWQFAAAVDPALDPLHFISRASGTPQQQDIAQGCFFTGRKEQLGTIKRWLEGPSEPTLMVVTGSPGSGKSALLGVVACLAHPQLRSVTHQISRTVDREVRPEPNPDLAAVHARQRGPAEVLASIAAQLDLGEEPGRGWTATAVLDRITEKRSRPVTVVVDALDEASSDSALVEALIQLAQSRRQPDEKDPDRDRVVCRVLVGTRPWWDRYGVLLKELQHSDQFVDLDQVPVKQRTAELTNYLCEIFETSPVYSGPGTAELRVATATAVAKQLGRRQEAGFLLASLFAHYLVHQDTEPFPTST
ncbi:AAA family ATPase [Streptomyces griseus]|uniref:AAA family ATPase n=1 Tax=Streptomyces griseus TaxID=1911 RepID=UPI0037B4CBE2